MTGWIATRTANLGGRFRLVISRRTPGGRRVDVSIVRGAHTSIDSYSDGDPFGDSTAQFTFGAITPFDDLTSTEFSGWLAAYADVDLYWLPAVPLAAQYPDSLAAWNPLTDQLDVDIPAHLLDGEGASLGSNQIKVWEGFIASMDWRADESGAGLQISCQGALFQLDRYLQKPFYPAQPWPLEKLIADVFNHRRKPHLRTRQLTSRYVQFPDGWKLVAPKYTGSTIYTPVIKPGAKWSGYASRQTGSWDHALTGFVQDQLAVMLTDERSGVTQGDQWTVQHLRQGQEGSAGRQPVLRVRTRAVTPDVVAWVGTPGMTLALSQDSTQTENVIYGDGTGIDGTVWRNAVISNDGSRTDYQPLAAAAEVYPADSSLNPNFLPGGFVSEAYIKYGTGFDESAARSSAAQALARDMLPGCTGTITIKTDLRSPGGDVLSRWLIHSGMSLQLRGLLGTGEKGVLLHISAVQHQPQDGSVELTVDSRFRDLLTVEEARARTRDPLTPVKMLQVNRTSVLIQDIQAPWDYSAGSGYVPRPSRTFYNGMNAKLTFPYEAWTKAHPPLSHPHAYVRCRANAPTSRGRWAGPIAILTSERDTIDHTQFAVYDVHGNLLALPFHVSIYSVNVTVDAMPHQGADYSPWRDGAFEQINQATGQEWPPGSINAPDQSLLIGWGNQAGGVMNRAGFSPGSEADGNPATGKLVDEASWNYDNTSRPNYQLAYLPGRRQPTSAITLWAMFYAEHSEPVYFLGRLYRENPGTS